MLYALLHAKLRRDFKLRVPKVQFGLVKMSIENIFSKRLIRGAYAFASLEM